MYNEYRDITFYVLLSQLCDCYYLFPGLFSERCDHFWSTVQEREQLHPVGSSRQINILWLLFFLRPDSVLTINLSECRSVVQEWNTRRKKRIQPPKSKHAKVPDTADNSSFRFHNLFFLFKYLILLKRSVWASRQTASCFYTVVCIIVLPRQTHSSCFWWWWWWGGVLPWPSFLIELINIWLLSHCALRATPVSYQQ